MVGWFTNNREILMNIIYVSDFFSEAVSGGAELNDEELINLLISKGNKVKKYRSLELSKKIVQENYQNNFIISNFSLIDEQVIKEIYNTNYIIYEHDHKYLANRDPTRCLKFKCNDSLIVNKTFYEKAKKVLCQSKMHKNILDLNLEIYNTINLSGNLWKISDLKFMEELSKIEKNDKFSILDSTNYIKNTIGCIEFCKNHNYNYELIKSNNYQEFLSLLSKNKNFCFLPKCFETFSRVVLEAKMMGINVYSNKLIGASHEDWFNEPYQKIIEIMHEKREDITNKTLEAFCG